MYPKSDEKHRKQSKFSITSVSNASFHCIDFQSVGIATRYGLDGQVIEFRWGWDVPYPSRPTLEPTQPPLQWVSRLFPGVKQRKRGLNHPPSSSVELEKTVPILPIWDFRAWYRANFTFTIDGIRCNCRPTVENWAQIGQKTRKQRTEFHLHP